MCNAYTIKTKLNLGTLEAVVANEAAKLKSPLVRRSDPGVVLIREKDELIARTMRWGFARPKFSSINNARSATITAGMWRESFENRRCLVPMSSFFEWQDLPHRAKQTYEFTRPDGKWLWVAGIYETSKARGDCFATMTTIPTKETAAIHDRLLAVVEFDHGLAFLDGWVNSFSPFSGEILTTPCISPLKRTGGHDNPQGLLF